MSPAASSLPACALLPRPPKLRSNKHALTSRSNNVLQLESSRRPRGGNGETRHQGRHPGTKADLTRHYSPSPGPSARNSGSSHQEGRHDEPPWVASPIALPKAAAGCRVSLPAVPILYHPQRLGCRHLRHSHLSNNQVSHRTSRPRHLRVVMIWQMR